MKKRAFSLDAETEPDAPCDVPSRSPAPLRGATDVEITRVSADGARSIHDSLAIEEPMEIRLVYHRDAQRHRRPVAVTMRTPGNDLELALGYLFNEGILSSRRDFRVASHFGPPNADGIRNVVQVELNRSAIVDLRRLERGSYTTSSCGVCGKTSIDAIASPVCNRTADDGFRVPSSLVRELPDRLRETQTVFETTGGLHAAALFTGDGEMVVLREDVGRHNALDKLVGRLMLDDHVPADRRILVLSGRASFELIQKASRAGIAVIVAIGAPSSLAVRLAVEHRITLIGFARADRFNVYSHPTRVAL